MCPVPGSRAANGAETRARPPGDSLHGKSQAASVIQLHSTSTTSSAKARTTDGRANLSTNFPPGPIKAGRLKMPDNEPSQSATQPAEKQNALQEACNVPASVAHTWRQFNCVISCKIVPNAWLTTPWGKRYKNLH